MDIILSQQAKEVIAVGRKEAIRLNNTRLQPEHLLLGILVCKDCVATHILKQLDVPITFLQILIERMVKEESARHQPSRLSALLAHKTAQARLEFAPELTYVLKRVAVNAKRWQVGNIDTGHILLAILDTEINATKVLHELNIYYEDVKELVLNRVPNLQGEKFEADDSHKDITTKLQKEFTERPSQGPPEGTFSTPALDAFGKDLSRMAATGKLDPVIGREKEIERVSQILSRRKKNNALLIGEPGVGKTAIAEGLALHIVQGKAPSKISNKRIIALDMTTIVAGTKYRGQFEERMKAIMQELQRSPDIILFIDEIHTIIGAGGSSGGLDAANILKPELARGEIQCIGATTQSEYRQYIEQDGALDRRFQTVVVVPPSTEEALEILNNIKAQYETHHSVQYTPEALEACVTLSERYISQRLLPDKAIDVLDEAGAGAHTHCVGTSEDIARLEASLEQVKQTKSQAVKKQQYEEAAELRDQERGLHEKIVAEKHKWKEKVQYQKHPVTAHHVAQVVAKMTGIPADRITQRSHDKLLNLADTLRQQVIGQDEAIDKVVKAIQRTHVGLHDFQKPLATFIFLGPTGVGKTALAKALSVALFGQEKALIRIDMSEYMEKYAVSRLVGAPPGYIGHEEGGQLTEQIRKNPYSVVLLDEIEKAHSEVYNLLLQMMDDGILTDGLGRTVDCRNTIVIMTSNLGARALQSAEVGFAMHTQQSDPKAVVQSKVHKALQNTFSPEFINRLDDVLVFNPLDKDQIQQILDIHLQSMQRKVAELGYQLDITPKAKAFMCTQGYDPKYGVRPLKRAIQQYLEDPLAAKILANAIQPGDTIGVSHKKDAQILSLKVKSPAVMTTA